MSFISKNIDVVIPTLNGKNLYKVIKSLSSGSLRPRNIICVYYYKFNFSVLKKKFKNIYFVKSNIGNQVQQRIEGFKHVNSKYVLQLDDDIILEKNALLNLMKIKIKLGDKALVGPVFLDLNNNSIHNLESNKYILSNIYKYIICGANYGVNKIGTITSLGLAYGVNSNIKKKIVKCQWLPGGCILLSKNVYEKSYDKFILSKKSFCEDIFFSIQRTRKKFSHYTITNALVYTKINKSKFDFLAYKDEIKNRLFLLNYTKGNVIRFYIWVIFEFFFRLVKPSISKN
jgi:glycosyltransferase involved in cell wall biosynthesis